MRLRACSGHGIVDAVTATLLLCLRRMATANTISRRKLSTRSRFRKDGMRVQGFRWIAWQAEDDASLKTPSAPATTRKTEILKYFRFDFFSVGVEIGQDRAQRLAPTLDQGVRRSPAYRHRFHVTFLQNDAEIGAIFVVQEKFDLQNRRRAFQFR